MLFGETTVAKEKSQTLLFKFTALPPNKRQTATALEP